MSVDLETPSPEVLKYEPPRRRTKWAGVILFAVLISCGVFGTPIYIYKRGLSSSELYLFLFYFYATGLSITVGYHRLFAHATYKTNEFIRFLLLFFGAATYEESALKWASQHRQHHQFTDTELDPHNSKRGFWYCQNQNRFEVRPLLGALQSNAATGGRP